MPETEDFGRHKRRETTREAYSHLDAEEQRERLNELVNGFSWLCQGNRPFSNQVLPGDLFCVFLVICLCHSMLDLAYKIEMKKVQMHTDS